jgi:general secretion pathway protein M
MTMDYSVDRFLARYPAAATAAYFALVLVLLVVAWYAAADLLDRRQVVADAEALLAQLERGRQTAAAPSTATGDAPQGSPFLEGQTVTVAGAALLQRVAGAVTRVGGNVLSSQVDVKEAQQKAGLVSLVASCELAQADLQKLLYDLEAGMPYLFVDQLTVQAPDTVTRGEGGRLRVVLGVSGQWQGSK